MPSAHGCQARDGYMRMVVKEMEGILCGDLNLAEDIARHVLDVADHPAILWRDNRSGFQLRMRQLIPGSYLKTTPERRRQFRDLLRSLLTEWREVAANKWERPGAAARDALRGR
jgi:hypothetical protein